jgi:hypothetical protein
MASGLIRSQLAMASKINKTSIYVDVQELFITLYDAQFEMPKRDRPIIVNRALGHCEMVAAYFALSYRTDDKIKYTKLLFAEFEALKMNIRSILRPDRPMIQNESTCNKIRNYIARIDESVVKWYKSLELKRQEECS